MIAEQMKRVPGRRGGRPSDIGVATDNNNNTGVILPGSTEQVNIGNIRSTRLLPTRWA
jgi:putative ABC transport system permease protein